MLIEKLKQPLEINMDEYTEITASVEALVFANKDPLSVEKMCEILGLEKTEVMTELERVERKFKSENHGFELVCVANKYQFRTLGRFSEKIKLLREESPRKLSAQALETLAIIAYRQPIVRSDVEKLRGVDAAPTIKTLLDRDLIKIVGHEESPGQPALYATTDYFLSVFGLRSVHELPSLRDLKEMDSADDVLSAPAE